MKIRKVTVIGVTGTMGANIAGIFASFGDATVYIHGRDIEKVKNTIPRIVKSVRADCIADRLIPADFSMLPSCVADSDLIFESSAENMDVKTEIAGKVADAMRPDAVSCTGTSGLSVTKLAECYPENLRSKFFGVHMFNPPYSMFLCEFIPTVYSDQSLVSELKEYLSGRLLRTVVEVKDTSAFLGNRIGFQFINAAIQYADIYKDNGGIDYIDSILGPFTGRSMAPLVTSDFVGLDVHKAIVDNVYENVDDYAHDTFLLPEFARKLISERKLGRKTGEGLYKTVKNEAGLKRRLVYDISTDTYRDQIPYVFPFAEEMKRDIANGSYQEAFRNLISNHSQEAEICVSFLLRYILYSVYTSGEIGDSVNAADDVMATGFSWCPPLAMYQALSSVTDVTELVKKRLPELCKILDVEELLGKIHPSGYDYRPFTKFGK